MKSIFSSILMISLFIGGSCTYDNEADLFGENPCADEVSLTQNVQPIVATRCAVPGCHVPGGRSPDFTQVSNIISQSAIIRTRTKDRTMPPPSSGITLTEAEIQTIDCWVQQGAHEN